MTVLELMMTPAVLASLVAALVTSVGLLAVLKHDDWANRNRVYFTAFAAGVLLTTGLCLLPSAFLAVENASLYALGGYLFLFAINIGFREVAGAVLAPFLAIGLHSFVDGFEYGVLFEHDIHIGIVASIGLIAHEFAEGVILYSVLRVTGMKRRYASLLAFLGAALTTPAGAMASQLVLGNLSGEGVGMLLAAAAGALLYLGATHLPAHMVSGRRTITILAYSAGVSLALGLNLVHSHDHEIGHDAHHEGSQDTHDHN